jgi:hypothetical protein
MAEMEAVEIAEGDDAPLKIVGDAAVEGEALHWRGLYRPNQWVGR